MIGPNNKQTAQSKVLSNCRICKSSSLVEFLTLGEQPHCNSFLTAQQLKEDEPRWPLNLLYCRDCHLVQLDCVVDAKRMFGQYLYVSGTTWTLRDHFRRTADNLVQNFEVPAGSLVVDIGSNDGTFLEAFGRLGLRTVGVDPAANIAEIARARGIATINAFFGERVARQIRREHGPARLVTAAGVFFHIDDMDDVCRGVGEVLDERGVFHIEAIYLGAMLQQTGFDNIYHEHVSYYMLRPLIELLRRFGLSVFSVHQSTIHGGSLMVYACHAGARPVDQSVEEMLIAERAKGWDTLRPYQEFAQRVEQVRDKLLSMLRALKAQGKRIAAYGAPAKGNTLLNYCGIGTELLEYAAERAPLKIGLYTPGTHIPVVGEEQAMENPPDYFLLLPWNFKEELIAKNRAYREHGGKFIIPIPTPHVI